MAVILAYGSPALGHLLPLGALLSELARRGHEVHVRTMSAARPTIRRAGQHAEPVAARIERSSAHDWLARNALEVLKSRLTCSAGARCWRSRICGPRSSGCDPAWSSWTRTAGVRCRRPRAKILRGWCSRRSRRTGGPPACRLGPGLRPLPGIVGRLRDASVCPIVRHLFYRPNAAAGQRHSCRAGAPPVTSVDEFIAGHRCCSRSAASPSRIRIRWADGVHLVGVCVFEPATRARCPDGSPRSSGRWCW